MSTHIESRSEADALKKLLDAILKDGFRTGPDLELRSVLLDIPFSAGAWESFLTAQDSLLKAAGIFGRQGWEKASRVYNDPKDRPTKPSYRSRLVAYPDRHRHAGENENTVNQLRSIARRLAQKPGYSCLSFVFLRPADLYDMFRPGYVPCPIAGDFKFRDGLLNLSVMFRTCDALAVAFADIFYLRQLQLEVLADAKSLTADERLLNGGIGNLNLYFSRVFVPGKKRLKNGSSANGRSSAANLFAALDNLVQEAQGS